MILIFNLKNIKKLKNLKKKIFIIFTDYGIFIYIFSKMPSLLTISIEVIKSVWFLYGNSFSQLLNYSKIH